MRGLKQNFCKITWKKIFWTLSYNYKDVIGDTHGLQKEKKVNKLDIIKIKNFSTSNIPLSKWKNMQQCKGNYMQNTYPIEDLYPEYAKNSEKDNRPTQK